MIKTKGFTIEELDHFRKFQRRSYAVLTAAAEDIRPGMTEQEVARRLRKAFHEEGVHTYFHVPVALFGSRTAYPGEFGKFEALATERFCRPAKPSYWMPRRFMTATRLTLLLLSLWSRTKPSSNWTANCRNCAT